jgi:hypothetical protein
MRRAAGKSGEPSSAPRAPTTNPDDRARSPRPRSTRSARPPVVPATPDGRPLHAAVPPGARRQGPGYGVGPRAPPVIRQARVALPLAVTVGSRIRGFTQLVRDVCGMSEHVASSVTRQVFGISRSSVWRWPIVGPDGAHVRLERGTIPLELSVSLMLIRYVPRLNQVGSKSGGWSAKAER